MGVYEACDISGFLQDYGPFMLIVIGLIVLVAYLYLYISRFFAYLKMKKAGTYIHEDTLDTAHRYLKIIGIGLLILAIVVVGEMIHTRGFEGFFELVRDYVFVFNAVVVFFVLVILGRLGSDAVRHHRQMAEADKTAYFKPGILEFWELFLKYGMYVFGVILAVLIGIATIPDATTRNDIYEALGLDTLDTAQIWGDILLLGAMLIILFLIGKFISIILEDFKDRTTKFTPGLIDLIKTIVRYSLYWLAFMITILVVLEMVEPIIAYIVIGFIMSLTSICILVIGLSPAGKSAISGLILLTTDSINKGDWIRVGDGKVGVVESQGLFFSRLRTRTGDIIDIPNELVLNNRTHNFTKLGGTLIRIAVRIDSSVPGAKAEELLLEAANGLDQSGEEHNLLKVSVLSLDSDSVEYNVDIWRKNPATTEFTISEFLKKFKHRASEEGIAILGTRLND
jgi:small-conductance mechanosensitive channel